MTENRKQFELAILNQFFKNRYAFMTEGRNEWFEVGLKSNQGNVYKITISIPLNYPYELPETAITFPTELRGFKRSKIKSFCHEMHTLSCLKSSLGLCLFHPSQWHPNQSIYKVIVKTKLWIEAYENHVKTGQNINTYLKC